MSGGKKDLFIGIFIIGFSIFIAFSALKLGFGSVNLPGPGFIPFFAALFLLILSFLLFFNSFKKRIVFSEAPKSTVQYGKIIFIIATLIGYSLLLDLLGFLFITFMLMFVLFLMESRKTLVSAIMGAFATTISVYILFELFLGVRFPKGVFGFWIK